MNYSKQSLLQRRAVLTAAVASVGVLLAACSSSPSVERVSAKKAVDVSGRWNDTDSRLVAEEMIQDCLARPWYTRARAKTGNPPVVVVGEVSNQSSEHIPVGTFVEDLQRALINSDKVSFVASSAERASVRNERAEQDSNASEATRKARGQEIGADYILSGTINSIVDKEGGEAVVFYQTNLKLLDVETNMIVWNGQNKIKKIVKRSRLGL